MSYRYSMFSKKVAVLVALVIIASLVVVGCTTSTTDQTISKGPLSNLSTTPPESLTRDPVIAGMIGTMDKTNIYNTTDAMQRIPTRAYGTAGNQEAADILYSRLSSIPGLKVEYNGSYKNIIGILPGTNTSSGDIVIVGAHYDSTSSDPAKAPGATDDACGVAIVLELARVMSHYQFNHTIVFALWNQEENGQQGSNAYVDAAAKSSQKIPLYINFDSSCYDPTGRFVLDIMYNSQSSWAAEMMTRDNTLYGINFALTYNVHTCNSDYKSFWSHGYPAVMTHEETHGPAHTPSDTIDKVSTEYALKNGQLGMAVLAQTAGVRAIKNPTTLTIASSTATPTAKVAFMLSGTLKSGTTPFTTRPIHLERRTYSSGTWGAWANVAGTYKYTNAYGKISLSQKVTTAGTYQYRWHYNGTTTYQPAYSSALTETVKKPTTTTALSASTTTPAVGQSVTFTATLNSGTTPLSGKSVTIYHYLNGVRYTDTTKTTNAYGKISLTQTFGLKGIRTYYATFAGDTWYKASKSSVLTINVH